MGANDTIETLISASRPAAVLLYSTGSEHCRYTRNPEAPNFENILTLVDPVTAMWVRDDLGSSGNGAVDASVFSDLSGMPSGGDEGGSGRDSGLLSRSTVVQESN